MNNVIINLWQLPQIILANILIKIWKAKYEQEYKGIKVYRARKLNGISLGTFIILPILCSPLDIKHEYGHTRQSLIFGWLYLIIIGIPSGSMNLLSQWNILVGKNYYKRWPENWADKLGEVER